MKKLAMVYFTYGAEFEELMLSIRSVLTTKPDAYQLEIYVFDDGDNACSDAQIAEIKKVANYQKTFWNRGGNLRGADHLIHATEIYSNLSFEYDAVVKVDSDTLVINQDWIEAFIQDKSKCVAGAFFPLQPQYLWGGAYALKNERKLNELHQDCKRIIAHGACYEDYEIGSRLFRICDCSHDFADRYQIMRDGFFQGEIIAETLNDVDKFLSLRVATFGFAKSEKNKGFRLQIMHKIIEILESKTESTH